jgi:membrane-associated phospholipid phosphatase
VRAAETILAVRRFDQTVDTAFGRIRGIPTADRFFYAVSELADFSLLWYIAATAKSLSSDDEVRDLARFSVLITTESALVNGGVKSFFQRTRPQHDGPRPHKLRQPLTTSFPSGHASAAFTAAALLSEGSSAWPVWYGLATVVALSRVHVKIHHASDVVAGAVLGAALGVIARRIWPRAEWLRPRRG